MKTLKLWRTFHEGMTNVRRNGWLSFATVAILSLSLFIIGLSSFVAYSTHLVLTNIKDKVNVTISFNQNVSEERIMEIKGTLEKSTREVSSVEYIPREQALAEFLAQNGNDESIRKALEEIGENPLFSSLVVKATDPRYYEVIAEAVQSSSFTDDISRINYAKNKKIFERIQLINRTATTAGLTLGSIFIAVALIITFYTMYITIHSHKQEFEIMRLVGASNLYMKMPFIFEGLFYGVVSSIIASVFLLTVSRSLGPITEGAMPLGGSTASLFLHHFGIIFIGLLALGIILTTLSASLAIRRYLKI
ncbi:MAG: cell division transport system permease protein [Patescibacteria group bacterium]|nr:cell division transport system permease protein [Patescibacteria group bacterium]